MLESNQRQRIGDRHFPTKLMSNTFFSLEYCVMNFSYLKIHFLNYILGINFLLNL